MEFAFNHIYEYREMLLAGALMTLKLTALSVLIGTVIGLIGALMRLARADKGNIAVRFIAWLMRTLSMLYVNFFRGTPLFVQVMIWFNVWFLFFVNQTDGLFVSGDAANELRRTSGPLIAGILALSANSGAYITEIFRAGIQSIDKGQMEAARSLGLSYMQAMRYVIVPQAFRRMLPPLGNEFITLLKDSSLLSVISTPELTYVAKTIQGRYPSFKEPYYTIAAIYLLMTVTIVWLLSLLEKRFNKAQHR